MHRLYVRIYLSVLGSLALFAMIAAATWHLFADTETFGPRPEFYVAAAEQLAPPANTASEELQKQLDHWHALSGYDLALFKPDGRLIAQATEDNEPFPKWSEVKPRRMDWHGPFAMHAVQLSDGRWLAVDRPRSARGLLSRFGWLAALLGIASAVGIASYPVVRRLTRGLEELQAGVEALGSGNLAARVSIKGRDEVARLAAKFNQSAARIEQLIQTNKQLLANASHELRSPLARLRMGIEGLRTAAPAGAQAEMVQNIHELDLLIEEILLASRLDSQTADQMHTEPVDLGGLAAEECAQTGAEIAIPSAVSMMVQGDPRLLRRLIRNLLENARRYGGGSAIEVVLRRAGSGIEMDVLDRGPGVPEAERQRIFQPFFRLPGARERDGSVGLGLSLVQQIAHQHGGQVVCLARDGGGSCFRLSLPASTLQGH